MHFVHWILLNVNWTLGGQKLITMLIICQASMQSNQSLPITFTHQPNEMPQRWHHCSTVISDQSQARAAAWVLSDIPTYTSMVFHRRLMAAPTADIYISGSSNQGTQLATRWHVHVSHLHMCQVDSYKSTCLVGPLLIYQILFVAAHLHRHSSLGTHWCALPNLFTEYLVEHAKVLNLKFVAFAG